MDTYRACQLGGGGRRHASLASSSSSCTHACPAGCTPSRRFPVARRRLLTARAQYEVAEALHTQQAPSGAAAVSAGAPQQAASDMGQAPQQQQDQEQELEEQFVEVVVTTETEEPVVEQRLEPRQVLHQAQAFLTTTPTGQALSVGALALGVAAVAVAAYQAYQKSNTAKARRQRLLGRNKTLVTELSKYLPDKRYKLTAKIVKGLKNSTGFDSKEVFRKYLWYVLRERKFDQEAVEDLVTLKDLAGLSDDDVAAAIGERAQKVYDTYGTLMLNTEGFTSTGVQRKAACRSLCQKILFLTECAALVRPGSEAASKSNLRVIFGATDDDLDKLRVANIREFELDVGESETLPDDELDESSGDEKEPPAPPKTALDSR